MAEIHVTEAAAAVLRRVRESESGELTISIDTGCCDGTAPHLYSDYVLPYGSREIGRAEGIPVFVPPHLSDVWNDLSIRLDVTAEEDSDVLSLETRFGKRLVMHQSGG